MSLDSCRVIISLVIQALHGHLRNSALSYLNFKHTEKGFSHKLFCPSLALRSERVAETNCPALLPSSTFFKLPFCIITLYLSVPSPFHADGACNAGARRMPSSIKQRTNRSGSETLRPSSLMSLGCSHPVPSSSISALCKSKN